MPAETYTFYRIYACFLSDFVVLPTHKSLTLCIFSDDFQPINHEVQNALYLLDLGQTLFQRLLVHGRRHGYGQVGLQEVNERRRSSKTGRADLGRTEVVLRDVREEGNERFRGNGR